MLRCSSHFPDQTSVPQPTATSAGKGGPAPWGGWGGTSLMVKTSPSSAEGVGLIPGGGS